MPLQTAIMFPRVIFNDKVNFEEMQRVDAICFRLIILLLNSSDKYFMNADAVEMFHRQLLIELSLFSSDHEYSNRIM